jgi:hypothetical protein
MKEYLPYLPIFTTLLTAIVAYVSFVRQKKLERFYSQVQERLDAILSPLRKEINKIQKIADPQGRMNAIAAFFEKYSGLDTKLYKLADRYLVKYFEETEENFEAYLANPSRHTKENFEKFFKSLAIDIETSYWDSFEALYREHSLLNHLLIRSAGYRILMGFVLFLYETFRWILILTTGVLITMFLEPTSRGFVISHWRYILLSYAGLVTIFSLLAMFATSLNVIRKFDFKRTKKKMEETKNGGGFQ